MAPGAWPARTVSPTWGVKNGYTTTTASIPSPVTNNWPPSRLEAELIRPHRKWQVRDQTLGRHAVGRKQSLPAIPRHQGFAVGEKLHRAVIALAQRSAQTPGFQIHQVDRLSRTDRCRLSIRRQGHPHRLVGKQQLPIGLEAIRIHCNQHTRVASQNVQYPFIDGQHHGDGLRRHSQLARQPEIIDLDLVHRPVFRCQGVNRRAFDGRCDLRRRTLQRDVPGHRQGAQIDRRDRSSLLIRDESVALEAFLGTGAGGRQRQRQKGTAGDHLFQSSALKTKNLARV